MKKSKKALPVILLLMAAFLLTSCTPAASPNPGQTTAAPPQASDPASPAVSVAPADQTAPVQKTYFKIGFTHGAEGPINYLAEALQGLLAERMPQYELTIYPGGQLGGERDMIESVQMGTQDMVIAGTAALANFVPSMMVGELLYLIEDTAHADAVYQGDIGRQLAEDCEAAGLHCWGFSEGGFRHYISNVPINSLADIQKLKLRLMENELHLIGWKIMGANAITMAWADAFAGMEQGAIDAMENPYSVIYSNSIYDVSKYIAETNHIYTCEAFLMSDKAWQQVADADKEGFKAIIQEACAMARDYCRKEDEAYKAKLISEHGMTVTTPDLTEWYEKAEELYAQYEDQYGDSIRAIKALAKQ